MLKAMMMVWLGESLYKGKGDDDDDDDDDDVFGGVFVTCEGL